MEQEFIFTKENGGYLTHFTNKVENLLSILNDGFIYRPNSTRIFSEILADLEINNINDERGMICFSELTKNLSYDKNSYMIEAFGPYGIVIDYNWALDNGLRKVAYIPSSGPIYEAIRLLFKSSLPNLYHIEKHFTPNGFDDIKRWYLSDSTLPDIFTNPLYSLLLELMLWVETDKHKEEMEYRLRAPFIFGGINSLGKEHQIPLMKGLEKNNIFSNALKLPLDKILFLICRSEDINKLSLLLKENNFNDISIKSYI